MLPTTTNSDNGGIDHLYRPGALWRTRSYVRGSGVNGQFVSIGPGVVVLVLEYKFQNFLESVVVLADGKWVYIEGNDLALDFDMEPNKIK